MGKNSRFGHVFAFVFVNYWKFFQRLFNASSALFFDEKHPFACHSLQKVHTLPGVSMPVFYHFLSPQLLHFLLKNTLIHCKIILTGDDFMKKFLAVFLALVLLFSGCTDKTESASSSSIHISEIPSQSEYTAESSGYENPYTSCVPEWSVSSPEPDHSYVHSTDTSSNISAESHTSQSGITSSSLPEYTSSP